MSYDSIVTLGDNYANDELKMALKHRFALDTFVLFHPSDILCV